MDDLKWFIAILIIFGAIWFAGGGIFRESSKDPYVRPIIGDTDVDIETYGGTGGTESATETNTGSENTQKLSPTEQKALEALRKEEETRRTEELAKFSPLRGKINLSGFYPVGSGNSAGEEKFILTAFPGNTEKIDITGLRVESALSGSEATVGTGAYLPFTGQSKTDEHIFLAPGETAIVLTRRSPLGLSFKLNKCSGYLQQFQQFIPSLPSSCPAPRDEVYRANNWRDLDETCFDYIDTLPSCQRFVNAPSYLAPVCQKHITENINYTSCVAFHKNEPDFYYPEWRVYLGRDAGLWRTKREILRFIDANVKVIQTQAY